MSGRFLKLLSILIVLTLVSLACNLGGPTVGTTPFPTLDPSALAESLKTSIAITPETGITVLTLNEQQVTSYLSQKIDEQPASPIENPQVVLQDGKMEIYGTAAVSKVTANIKLVIKIAIDAQGVPSIDLESANFGPISVPSSLTDYLTRMLSQAVEDGFGSNPEQMRILDVQITDGLMIITLQKNS
jgi:hypothetical protein